MTSHDFHSHAGVLVPVHRVEFDVACNDGFVQVGVLHAVRIRVSLEHLQADKIHLISIIGHKSKSQAVKARVREGLE